MKLLMFSTDRKLFEPNSNVLDRMIKLSSNYDKLIIVVLSLKKNNLAEIEPNDRLSIIPTNSPNRLFYIFNAFSLGRQLIRQKNFGAEDEITCQDPFEVGLIGFLLKKFHGLKLELQIHTDLYSPYFKKHSILNFLRLLIADLTLPVANKIRVVSNKIAQSLTDRGINKGVIEIRPIDVDLQKFSLAPNFSLKHKYPEFNKIILIVSRLEKEKGVDLAIKIFSELRVIKKDVGLVIVGDGRERNNLSSLTQQLGVLDYVRFEGWQSDLNSYYKGADLLLVTSYYEGYGLVFKEAQVCNCKIISTDVGIAREVGAKIVSRSVVDIAEVLLNTLK